MKMLRSSISSVFYYGICLLGKKESGTRILCYHHIGNETKSYMSVSCSNFKLQMKFLADQGFQTVSLSDLVSGTAKQGSIVLTFDDGYVDNYENAYPIMKDFGFRGAIFCIAKKIGKPGYLNTEQMKEMVQSGFEFGSHTSTHPELPLLTHEEKKREILGSKNQLEQEIGVDINFFCYPKGLYDQEVLTLVEEARYQGACSNAPGTNTTTGNGKNFNPYLLKRTEIASYDSLGDFQKKLAGAYDPLHRLLHALRGRP